MKVFQKFEKAGVIYVMDEARKAGYTVNDKSWCNFGQGSAEPGKIKNAPKRIMKFKIPYEQNGYAPVSGLNILRKHVCDVYNDLFRKNKKKYNLENVDISGGGRMAISRVIATLNKINLAYLVPDYASYEGIISVFNNVNPIPYFLNEKNNFDLDIEEFRKFIKINKIKAFLLSNPSNPTGNVISGKKLKELIDLSRSENFFIIIDEFYFNYIFNSKDQFVSAAKYIKDPQKDPVIIIAGLSKAWRYSGWRVCWSIAPRDIIYKLNCVGSFLDGGASNPLQNASLQIVNSKHILKETNAIKETFTKKMNLVYNSLSSLGFEINKPKGSFYVWAKVDKLTSKINDCDKFFKEGLKEKIITVPGKYFDLNPFKRRKKPGLMKYVRFSFGPNIEQLKIGLNSVRKLITKF